MPCERPVVSMFTIALAAVQLLFKLCLRRHYTHGTEPFILCTYFRFFWPRARAENIQRIAPAPGIEHSSSRFSPKWGSRKTHLGKRCVGCSAACFLATCSSYYFFVPHPTMSSFPLAASCPICLSHQRNRPLRTLVVFPRSLSLSRSISGPCFRIRAWSCSTSRSTGRKCKQSIQKKNPGRLSALSVLRVGVFSRFCFSVFFLGKHSFFFFSLSLHDSVYECRELHFLR